MIGERCSFRDYEFLKDVTDKLLKLSRIAYPWDATKFNPNITGIPPHVTLMDDMERMRRNSDALRAEIEGDMDDMMEKMGVGGLECHTNKALEAI